MRKILLISALFTLLPAYSYAKETTTQFPALLQNTYFGLQLGSVSYPFTNQALIPGYQASDIKTPHLAARAILGYQINPYLAAQISLMRPFYWVRYNSINGDKKSHSVWMSLFGITLKPSFPITKRFSVYAEGGVGIVSRHGIYIGNTTVLPNSNYVTPMLGAGLQYQMSRHWLANAGFIYSPANHHHKEPHTLFIGAGIQYSLSPLSPRTVESNALSGYFFPSQLIQIGYSTDKVGFGANKLFGKKIHIFWEGDVHVKQGYTISYQRNIFHTAKYFSLGWGASYSYWTTSLNHQGFSAVSLFPIFRFWLLRTKMVDFYFDYSLAGPAYLTQKNLDNINTGKNFTFQDFMGVGAFLGKSKHFNVEVKIMHYSNGNLFSRNPGIAVPLVFNFGYVF